MTKDRSPCAPQENPVANSPGKSTAMVPRPRWVPLGLNFAALPRQLQEALVELVNPLYEQLVSGPGDPLVRSTGLSVVQLLWMELANQLRQGETFLGDALLASLNNHAEPVAEYLQLIDSKAKMTCVLIRLRELIPNTPCQPAPDQPPSAYPGLDDVYRRSRAGLSIEGMFRKPKPGEVRLVPDIDDAPEDRQRPFTDSPAEAPNGSDEGPEAAKGQSY